MYEQLNGRLTRLTEDDSLVASLKGAGEPSADARGRHPLRNVLTNVVGGEEQIDVHVSEWPRLPGRRLLLCSDGVHGAMTTSASALSWRPRPPRGSRPSAWWPKLLRQAAATTPRRWSWPTRRRREGATCDRLLLATTPN